MAPRMANSDSTATKRPATLGWVDEPRAEGVPGPTVRIEGWALSDAGIRAVEARLGEHRYRARYGLPRHDVAQVYPEPPDNPNSGFVLDCDFSAHPAPYGVLRRMIHIVAIANDGSETLLGRRSLVEPEARGRWQFVAARNARPFYVIPALSGIAAGGAYGLQERYAAYESPTTRIGMRVPILYLRTTLGADADYRFDADFDIRREHRGRLVADDSLALVLAHSRTYRLPVLVTLNGGIWADSGGTCPAWDQIDRLEEDPANCQWNEHDEVMPDDHLAHLPGSQAAPELSRALTLNVFARDVRERKRRNLTEAARHLVAFMREHDDLFIGVTLDPDCYVNPFFEEAQWYDYNPDTLAQFRHWLAGTGPYRGEGGDPVSDLSRWRRSMPLSLADVCRIAGRSFACWEDVDPPRVFRRDAEAPYWNDPWVREWEHFRRHLVAVHYDELAQWLVDAGIPRDRIWSAQGLMGPAENAMPLAMSIESPVKNYDSGGVSIEGSKPRDGHLGAIVYGAAATNEVVAENGHSLFATLARIDPQFAIVEFNTADLRNPARRPTYRDAYRALRDLWNAGACFVSPMAWNGSEGLREDDADYVTFTAWRNTPLESATCDFLLERLNLPLGSRLWTFGTPSHADDDGWSAEAGSIRVLHGALELTADARGIVALVSPRETMLDAHAIERVIVGLPETVPLREIAIDARAENANEWRRLTFAAGDAIETTSAGRAIVVSTKADRTESNADGSVDRLRITFHFTSHARSVLSRVAILCPD